MNRYVSVDIEKGSDLDLMDAVLACLKGMGRATSVRTGSDMFVRELESEGIA